MKPMTYEILSYHFEPQSWPQWESKKQINMDAVKQAYPELSYWSAAEIVAAKHQYFDSVYYVDWIDIQELREVEFLAWLYVLQETGKTLGHIELLNGEIDKAAVELWNRFGAKKILFSKAAANEPGSEFAMA